MTTATQMKDKYRLIYANSLLAFYKQVLAPPLGLMLHPSSRRIRWIELAPFHGHLITHKKGVKHVNRKKTAAGAIPSTNG